MTAPPNAHNKSYIWTRNTSMITESSMKCKLFFQIFQLQQNRLYPARIHKMIHSISTNVFGRIIDKIIPTAIQNRANPITFLFKLRTPPFYL
jgi:hypothetical protein